ncbi:MAG: Hsp20/alpha crystallin family protein [Planctomycetaceae bacterium]
MATKDKNTHFPQLLARRSWTPAADVYRTRQGWLVKVELAGVQTEDVHVEFCGSTLTLSGQRRDVMLDICQCCYSLEISYDRFERHLDLGIDLSTCTFRTEIQNGMLLIHIQSTHLT